MEKNRAVIESDNTIKWIMICSATASLIYHYISIKSKLENECATIFDNKVTLFIDKILA